MQLARMRSRANGSRPETLLFVGRTALKKIARMAFTAKLDGNWSSFQLANSAPPSSVIDSAIAPSARMHRLPAWGRFQDSWRPQRRHAALP